MDAIGGPLPFLICQAATVRPGQCGEGEADDEWWGDGDVSHQGIAMDRFTEEESLAEAGDEQGGGADHDDQCG